MFVNIWLGLSDSAQDIVITSLRWDEETQGEYSGPLRNRSRRLFEYMQDDTVRRKLFAKANLGGTLYNLWSISFDDSGNVLQLIRDELDYLIAQYPGQIGVVGAWKKTGEMVGCSLVLTEVPNPEYVGEPYHIPNPDYQPDPELPDYDARENLRNPAYVPETLTERSQTGTPLYPIPNYLWRFIPDTVEYDGDGNETSRIPPTSNADLRDINVLLGQAPRIFD